MLQKNPKIRYVRRNGQTEMKATKNQAARDESSASDQLFQIRRRFEQCLRKVILKVFKIVIRCARQKYVKYAQMYHR